MELSKGQRLKNKIDEFCNENNISEEEAKKMFLKNYFLPEDGGKTPDEMMGDFLHPKREE